MKIIFFVTTFLLSTISFSKATEPKSPIPFEQIRQTLCRDYDNKFVETCTEEDFTINHADLNGDGTNEWFYSGPTQFGGATANFDLHIFSISSDAAKWKILYTGTARTIELLDKKPLIYKDILTTIYGGTIQTNIFLRWNGKAYQKQREIHCDFDLDEQTLPKECFISGQTIFDARE